MEFSGKRGMSGVGNNRAGNMVYMASGNMGAQINVSCPIREGQRGNASNCNSCISLQPTQSVQNNGNRNENQNETQNQNGNPNGSVAFRPLEQSANFTVGMAFVPMQKWERTYDLAIGRKRGTIFPSLDLPFMMGRCR